jgi:GT2 family glycosyltransferase
MTDLAIVIVSFNTKELTLKCLKSITEEKWRVNYQIWVVDNNSSDSSVEVIEKQYPQVKIIKNKENIGFAGANNLALNKAEAKNYLLLNSDTEVFPGSLDNLVDFMERSGFGIVSCRLIGKDGKLQPNVGDLPFGLALFSWLAGLDDILFFLRGRVPSYHQQFAKFYQGEKEVGWVSGSVMMIKGEVVKKIGGLDDQIFMYGEDSEYCLRAKKASFRVGWTDKAVIHHLGGGSSKDPAYKQWIGEFHGLLYLYQKYYNIFIAQTVRLLIYIFIIIRMVAFFIVGKPSVSKTYGKIIINL